MRWRDGRWPRWGRRWQGGKTGRPCACLTARRSSGFDCNVPFSRRRLPTGMKWCPGSSTPSSQNSRVSPPSIAALDPFTSIGTPIPAATAPTSPSQPSAPTNGGAAHRTAVHVPAPPFRTPTPHCLFQSRPYPRYGRPFAAPVPLRLSTSHHYRAPVSQGSLIDIVRCGYDYDHV